MKHNPTLDEVKQAVETMFEPDIVLGVTEDGRIYSRSPRTRLGWKFMRVTRGVENIDKARQVAAGVGIFATIETH